MSLVGSSCIANEVNQIFSETREKEREKRERETDREMEVFQDNVQQNYEHKRNLCTIICHGTQRNSINDLYLLVLDNIIQNVSLRMKIHIISLTPII